MVSKTSTRAASRAKPKQTQKQARAGKHSFTLIGVPFKFRIGMDSDDSFNTGVKLFSDTKPTHEEMHETIVKYIIDEKYPQKYHMNKCEDLYFCFYGPSAIEYYGLWLRDVIKTLRKH